MRCVAEMKYWWISRRTWAGYDSAHACICTSRCPRVFRISWTAWRYALKIGAWLETGYLWVSYASWRCAKAIRTCARAHSFFFISGTAGRTALKFGVLMTHNLAFLQKPRVGYICKCARAYITFPYLAKGWTPCPELCYVDRGVLCVLHILYQDVVFALHKS